MLEDVQEDSKYQDIKLLPFGKDLLMHFLNTLNQEYAVQFMTDGLSISFKRNMFKICMGMVEKNLHDKKRVDKGGTKQQLTNHDQAMKFLPLVIQMTHCHLML